jgi:transcriptional regulator with XRE-family HTH domain
MANKKLGFETSSALRTVLVPLFEEWKRRHGGDLNELAERCGVSSAYLSHVRRYGRIPSKPVLLLLAFNLKTDGARLFQAAGITEPFPYEPELTITRPAPNDDGLFSFRFNMDRFSDSIRSIVRSELRTRSVKDILGTRPLRIGVNYHMFWMFGSRQPPSDGKHTGLFPELAEMLGLALQKDIELVSMPFSNYHDSLASGEIDLFGPTMIVPNLPSHIAFTQSIFRLGVSALMRKRDHPDLPKLAPPSIEDLRDESYRIAVLKNSLPHLVANTRLKRPDSTLILVSSDDEAIERLTLRSVGRPAHIFITNSMRALISARESPKELSLLFADRSSLIDLPDVSIAVRPDWPELIPVFNDALKFLYARGGLSERFAKLYKGDAREVVEFS